MTRTRNGRAGAAMPPGETEAAAHQLNLSEPDPVVRVLDDRLEPHRGRAGRHTGLSSRAEHEVEHTRPSKSDGRGTRPRPRSADIDIWVDPRSAV